MNMLKMKKSICLFLALFAAVPTPARASDDVTQFAFKCMYAGAAIVVAGITIYYFSPYSCGVCGYTISKGEPFVERESCTHRFHTHCHKHKYTGRSPYTPNVTCRYCEQNKKTVKEINQAIHWVTEAEKARLQQERQRLLDERLKAKHQEAADASYARDLQLREAREAARVQQEELRRIQQERYKNDEAARVQQQEIDRLKREQERAERQAQADARYARDLQLKEQQQQAAAFKREQDRLKAIPGMIQPCPICHRALAQLSPASPTLVDLKKSEHAQKIQALSCGHVCHTECVRKNQTYKNMCPGCKAAAEKNRLDAQLYQIAQDTLQNRSIPSAPTEAQIQTGEQEQIKNTPWMMQQCPICLDELAKKDENFINLKDKKHAHYIVALPCGHMYHTHCIKQDAAYRDRCSTCNTQYNVNEL